MMPVTRSLGWTVAFFLLSVAPSPAQKQTTDAGQVTLSAKSANVAEPGIPVNISILRWSTDAERNPVVIALDPVAQAAAQAAAAAGGRGGGARAARGGLDPNDPAL